jgi:hypothetical protein
MFQLWGVFGSFLEPLLRLAWVLFLGIWKGKE